MMKYEELIKELRECRNKAVLSEYWWEITAQAADAIEELLALCENFEDALKDAVEELTEEGE